MFHTLIGEEQKNSRPKLNSTRGERAGEAADEEMIIIDSLVINNKVSMNWLDKYNLDYIFSKPLKTRRGRPR